MEGRHCGKNLNGRHRLKKKLAALLDLFGSERRINYSLERFQRALADVQNPERSVYSVIISGTNGKGSTTLFTSAALTAHGYRVCTFLSPHLQSINERFLLNMVPAKESELFDLAQTLLPTARRHELSYFEFLTLLFFTWAKGKRADRIVLEVGLGGRLDATNVTVPQACALTNVAFDHQAYLGNTLREILTEKLGVVPRGGRLYTAVKNAEQKLQIQAACKELEASVEFTEEFRVQRSAITLEGQTIVWNGHELRIANPTPGAAENAVLAFTLLEKCFPEIPAETVAASFANVLTPGRMEWLGTYPNVILSGDHNPAGIECLIDSLQELGIKQPKIVCALAPDKPYSQMITRLNEITDSLTLTQIKIFDGQMADDYAKINRDFIKDAVTAVQAQLAACGPRDTLLITGSLYLVGEVRKLWRSSVQFLKTPSTIQSPIYSLPDATNRAITPSAVTLRSPEFVIGDAVRAPLR
jgi:dihydrofolate synthase/folylpolyglutamate synthase